jgi:predicted porin
LVRGEALNLFFSTLENFSMKKTLIALAAVAVSSAAMAQVTVYGLIDTSYTVDSWKTTYDNGDTFKATQNTVAGNRTAGNRLGFRGVEEIEGGMKATFLLESGVATLSPNDTTTAPFANIRQAFAGIEGGFGAITAGYQYTGDFRVSGGYLAGTENTIGNAHDGLSYAAPALAAGAAETESNLHDYADANARVIRATVIQYVSPSISGAKFVGQWSGRGNTVKADGADVAGTTKSGVMALGVDYDAGPLSVKAVHQTTTSKASVTNVETEQVAMIIGGSFDLGMAKLIGQYGERKLTVTNADDNTTTHYNVGVQVPMGKITLAASAGMAEQKLAAGTIDQDTYQLMASYALSKRTTAYANYGSEQLKWANAKDNATAMSVGLRHSF